MEFPPKKVNDFNLELSEDEEQKGHLSMQHNVNDIELDSKSELQHL